VALQNFRYAPAAASGLALVTGSSKEMPDLFDYLLPASVEDSLQSKIPKVEYASSRFLPSGKMAFDIVREVKTSRCYYCHTNADVALTGSARWKANEDVHLGAGSPAWSVTATDSTTTLRAGMRRRGCLSLVPGMPHGFGCQRQCARPHGRSPPLPRRHSAAPLQEVDLHRLPFRSVAEAGTRQMKNGMTHGLGEYNVNKSAQTLPHVYYPVFAQQPDGKLAPNRLIWPAFWGRLRQGRCSRSIRSK